MCRIVCHSDRQRVKNLKNSKTDYINKIENLKIWVAMVVILVFALCVISDWMDKNTHKTIIV